jgi:hypothetical protein
MITICIKLGYVLKCSPFEFADMRRDQLIEFMDMAADAIDDLRG